MQMGTLSGAGLPLLAQLPGGWQNSEEVLSARCWWQTENMGTSGRTESLTGPGRGRESGLCPWWAEVGRGLLSQGAMVLVTRDPQRSAQHITGLARPGVLRVPLTSARIPRGRWTVPSRCPLPAD